MYQTSKDLYALSEMYKAMSTWLRELDWCTLDAHRSVLMNPHQNQCTVDVICTQ